MTSQFEDLDLKIGQEDGKVAFMYTIPTWPNTLTCYRGECIQ